MKYAALDGASFGGLRFLISSRLSKLLWHDCHFRPKNEVFGLPLAKIWKYQKSETIKGCAEPSCILYVPNTKLSDQYLWPSCNGSFKKSSIFDGVGRLPCRLIKLAGSKTETVANTKYSIHGIQHSPRIVRLPVIFTIMSWPLTVAWTSGVPPCKIDCHQPALH